MSSFKVRRRDPELVVPAIPTPRELKQLSDIDDQEGLRLQSKYIFFYKNNVPSRKGQDPVKVIKEALRKALVHYYPLAGRLREGLNRKLSVDCSGEGVLFIEASADILLEKLSDAFLPPYPFLDDVLFNVPSSDRIVDCPLLLIQVTRLLCGGFILAVRLNHTMADGFGLVQFLKALAEMAHGAMIPEILPVWQRELLSAREPPRVTHEHREYEEKFVPSVPNTKNMIQRSFFFSFDFVKRIRKELPEHLANCSSYVLLTGCLWKCRSIALQFDPKELVSVLCVNSARGTVTANLPQGFYGNAFAYTTAVSSFELLRKNPFAFAVELVKTEKDKMCEEYMRSFADLMAIRGRPLYDSATKFLVSDMRFIGIEEIDFGWGLPAYAGPAVPTPLFGTSLANYQNAQGKKGIVASMFLPRPAMERFESELEKITWEPNDTKCNTMVVDKAVSKL